MDDPEFGMKENVLARMAHSFHMHEMWTKVNVETEKFAATGVDTSVCDCALDVQGSGVVDDRGYRRWNAFIINLKKQRGLRPEEDGNPNLPILTDGKTWTVWREMQEDSMLHQEEL